MPQPGAEVLRTAFATAAGQTSQLNEMGEAGYYIVQVDNVTPATVKPLDDSEGRGDQDCGRTRSATRRWRTSPRR